MVHKGAPIPRFPDPGIVMAALAGRLPRGYGLSRLTNLPLYWPDQWRALGLPKPGQKLSRALEAIKPSSSFIFSGVIKI